MANEIEPGALDGVAWWDAIHKDSDAPFPRPYGFDPPSGSSRRVRSEARAVGTFNLVAQVPGDGEWGFRVGRLVELRASAPEVGTFGPPDAVWSSVR